MKRSLHITFLGFIDFHNKLVTLLFIYDIDKIYEYKFIMLYVIYSVVFEDTSTSINFTLSDLNGIL